MDSYFSDYFSGIPISEAPQTLPLPGRSPDETNPNSASSTNLSRSPESRRLNPLVSESAGPQQTAPSKTSTGCWGTQHTNPLPSPWTPTCNHSVLSPNTALRIPKSSYKYDMKPTSPLHYGLSKTYSPTNPSLPSVSRSPPVVCGMNMTTSGSGRNIDLAKPFVRSSQDLDEWSERMQSLPPQSLEAYVSERFPPVASLEHDLQRIALHPAAKSPGAPSHKFQTQSTDSSPSDNLKVQQSSSVTPRANVFLFDSRLSSAGECASTIKSEKARRYLPTQSALATANVASTDIQGRPRCTLPDALRLEPLRKSGMQRVPPVPQSEDRRAEKEKPSSGSKERLDGVSNTVAPVDLELPSGRRPIAPNEHWLRPCEKSPAFICLSPKPQVNRTEMLNSLIPRVTSVNGDSNLAPSILTVSGPPEDTEERQRIEQEYEKEEQARHVIRDTRQRDKIRKPHKERVVRRLFNTGDPDIWRGAVRSSADMPLELDAVGTEVSAKGIPRKNCGTFGETKAKVESQSQKVEKNVPFSQDEYAMPSLSVQRVSSSTNTSDTKAGEQDAKDWLKETLLATLAEGCNLNATGDIFPPQRSASATNQPAPGTIAHVQPHVSIPVKGLDIKRSVMDDVSEDFEDIGLEEQRDAEFAEWEDVHGEDVDPWKVLKRPDWEGPVQLFP